jgi:hypothetical protein
MYYQYKLISPLQYLPEKQNACLRLRSVDQV